MNHLIFSIVTIKFCVLLFAPVFLATALSFFHRQENPTISYGKKKQCFRANFTAAITQHTSKDSIPLVSRAHADYYCTLGMYLF